MSSYSSRSHLGFVLLAVLLVQSRAFTSYGKLTVTSRLSPRLTMSEVEDDLDDPYGSLFDLNKPAEKLPDKDLVSLWSIDKSAEKDLPIVKARVKPLSAQQRWEHWDDFMEEELGDLDAELSEEDKWMQEIRDAVELKRGFAIWSKKSEKELQRESRRSVASRTMNVPENVAMVIRAVFLEKTHTMKQLKKEEELACIEFRKWMIEQKKKTKRDPLPAAKSEVARRWLLKHPNTSGSYSRTKPPPVVMDELSLPATTPGVAFAVGKLNSTPQPKTAASTSTAGSGTSLTNVVTPSMSYWDKPITDVPVSWTRDPPKATEGADNASTSTAKKGKFAVDGVDMFVANKANDEFFVVL